MPKTAPIKYTLYDPSKPLSSIYKRRAAKELGENPDQVSAHLESFRRWLTSMPHLKCTTANFSLDAISMAELQGASQIWNDANLVDPRIQIGGICMVADLTNLRKEDIMRMFEPKLSKIGTKYFQECLPFRIKKLIYYNTPKVFESLFNLYSEWLKEKVKSRIMVLGSDLSPAFDAVEGLRELMPESYGGDNKHSLEEICEATANMLKSIPDVGATFTIEVDESKRPNECRNQFGVYKDPPSDVMGKSGIFVKLNQGEI
ncbi:unnamed protein product [Taenia asiatica]|uniref:CRAL-TRIO domain-containing protein n=1 Tax=Taenia asiatica TaxID=60517 RepID=A0A0R3VWT5_TAEAS|nr:unnamed protein product [Taenia asiatica]